MTSSSVARRRSATSFAIADLIGPDIDAGCDDDEFAARPQGGVAEERNSRDTLQAALEHCHGATSTGAFHVYRPTSIANGDFYQACYNWIRSRGMHQFYR